MLKKEAVTISPEALEHMTNRMSNYFDNITPAQIAKLKKAALGANIGLHGLGAVAAGIPIYKAIKAKRDDKLEKVPEEHQWSRLKTGAVDLLWEPVTKGIAGTLGGAILGGAAGAAIGKAKGVSNIGALIGAGLGGTTGLVGGTGLAAGNIIANQIKGPEYVDPAAMRGKAYGTIGGILGGPLLPVTMPIGYYIGKESKLKEMNKESSDNTEIQLPIRFSKIAKADILYPFHDKAKKEKEDGYKALYNKVKNNKESRDKFIREATAEILKKQKYKIAGSILGAAGLLGAGYLAKKHLQKESSLEKLSENKERTMKDYGTTIGLGALFGGASGGIAGASKGAVKKYHAKRRQNYVWNLGDDLRYEDKELLKHKYDRTFYGDKKARNIMRRRSALQGALKGAGISALLGTALAGSDYAIKKYKQNKD